MKALIGLTLLLFCFAAASSDKITFWDTPQHGGNSFNRLPPTQEYYDALRGYGATWVRLSYDKWKPAGRDFLLGNADGYRGLEATDLATLKASIRKAHAAGLQVVIAPLSLPGMRWAQNNNNQFDDRIWQDKKYWQEAAQFWRDLAQALKDEPGIAAWNLVNEPAPEKRGNISEQASPEALKTWYQQQQSTARNLPALYNQIIAAIREVDATTPIMVDGGWYASARGFSGWPSALKDKRVLYSFHMYEPYDFTSAPNARRKVPFDYPGMITFGGKKVKWGATAIEKWMNAPFDWAKQNGIPANRVVAGEFGCVRTLQGCRQWLNDVLTVLDKHHAHWAFYAFREDAWDAMDYELGKKPVPWAYWKAIEDNAPDTIKRHSTEEFEPISKRLKQGL